MKTMLNIALPKGRLGEKVYAMFEKAGFPCPSIKENSRKLIFENEEVGIRYFWVKPSDVAIYVERGAADIGVAGKDILLLYDDTTPLSTLRTNMALLTANGRKVMAQRAVPANVRYKEILNIKEVAPNA